MESSGILAIVARVAAIVFAGFLLIASAATIGFIENNEALEALRDFDGQLTGILADLLDLFNGSLGIAGWLIVICIVVVTADIIFIVINLVLPWNVIFGVTELVFSVIVMLCSLATGIASAVFASEWGKPPEACALANSIPDQDNVCDSDQLTVTNAIQSVFSFLLFGALVATASVATFMLLTNKSQKK